MRYALVGTLVVFGCVGTGKLDEQAEVELTKRSHGAHEVQANESEDGLDRPRIRVPSGARARSYNVTLTANKFEAAAEQAREAIEDMGAEVLNVSANVDYANINARIDPVKCKTLPAKIRGLGYPVQNENSAANDLAGNVRQSQDRLARIDRADRELQKILRGVSDGRTADGLLLLRELANNERRNLDSQLSSYADQAKYCQVYVNFQKPQPVSVIER